MFEHLVLFKFKAPLPDAKEDELLAQLRAFKGRIPGIVELTAGRNATRETDNIRGYTLALRVTFADEASLAAYGPHPLHQAFVRALDGLIDSVVVADYPAEA